MGTAHDTGSWSRGLVGCDGERLATRTDEGLGRFLAGTKDLRLGWAELPDFEVVYLSSAGDGGFEYTGDAVPSTRNIRSAIALVSPKMA